MDLITFILITMIFVILIGCIFLANIDMIADFFSGTSVADYGKYKINFIDDTDIKYIKLFLSQDTLNQIGTQLLLGNNSNKTLFPNATMTNEQLMGPGDRYMGNELPWDKEVGQCDIVKNMDIDLYKNVQDSKIITFW